MDTLVLYVIKIEYLISLWELVFAQIINNGMVLIVLIVFALKGMTKSENLVFVL
jgi:hypothetical protein